MVASTALRDAVSVQFAPAGAATVLVAAALREALLRLDESRAAEAKVQADLAATEVRFLPPAGRQCAGLDVARRSRGAS